MTARRGAAPSGPAWLHTRRTGRAGRLAGGIGSRTIRKKPTAHTSATAAPPSRAGAKEPVACTVKPVTVGASAPPRYPPKFCIAPSDAVLFCRAAIGAIAQADVLDT